MSFTNPWLLTAFVPVAAVAAWALLRPARQMLAVASVTLWTDALAALDRSSRRPSRRVTAAWVLLLAGAVAAALASAGPRWHRAAPSRRVAVALHASAELAGDGGAAMRTAAGRLLDRLAPQDRVQLIRPAALGGGSRWLSPDEARAALEDVPPLPVPAARLDLPAAPGEARWVYHVAGPGADETQGPRVSVIRLAGQLPPVVIEDVGAERLPDGSARAFVAVRNVSSEPWGGQIDLRSVAPRGSGGVAALSRLAPGARAERTFDVPPVEDAPDGWVVELRDAGGAVIRGPGAAAFLARTPREPRRVRLAGRDEPLLRRFVAAHDGLEPVADPARAHLVIANAPTAPLARDVPALVIDPAPAAGPAGYRRGERLDTVVLGDAHVAPGPLTGGVSLDGVIVRRLRPWVADGGRASGAYVRLDAGAIVVQREADARRVYVAFDLGQANTNFAAYPSFVVFLSRAVDWLVPPAASGYTAVPARAAAGRGWQPLARPHWQPPDGPLPWPGLYRDGDGGLHAVALGGLSDAGAASPAIDDLPLPQPVSSRQPLALWPVFAMLAGLLWLGGWALRVR